MVCTGQDCYESDVFQPLLLKGSGSFGERRGGGGWLRHCHFIDSYTYTTIASPRSVSSIIIQLHTNSMSDERFVVVPESLKHCDQFLD